ncbi:MAG: hypothetical protein E7357_02355 [Clostridiales bacterium]|nr:hypothetical protein [Clostridiales bacterium]
MRTKNNLRKLVWSVFAVILALFCITLFNIKPSAVAKADGESAQIVTLYDPSGETSGNYTTSDTTVWKMKTAVEDYTDSPTGKVLHHTIDNTEYANETWPNLRIKLPYTGDTTGFAGYIVWLEYDATMYTNSSFYGLFGTNLQYYATDTTAASSVALGGDKPITFIDANGKVSETLTGRGSYHHNNATKIENSEYTHAYTYDFKGYMIIPATSYSGDVTPNANTFFNMNHHYQKTIVMDLKIGMVGFYTDYDALLTELGRCTYSFVDGETTVETGNVRPGTEIVAPTYNNSYVKNGKTYTFIGWRGYIDGMTISEDMTFTAVYKVTDFHMVKGASIRTNEGTSGIRYTAEFDEDLYNEISLDENREFGMVITKLDYYNQAMASNANDLIAGLNELGNNKYVLITESSANPLKVYPYTTETKVTYRISGALTNIQYDHADWTWMGVGVIVETDGENVRYTYAVHTVDDSARTTSYVASAALNNPNENFTSVEKATLKNYVYKSAAKSAGVTETNFKAQEDKSSYLADYTLTVGGGFDTQYKFNENVAGEEAYMTIGEKAIVDASIVNDNGEALDVAYSINVTDSSVLSVNGAEVTAMKNGYTTVTIACELFGYSKQLTVYTGSTDAGNRANNSWGSNENASKAGAATGEIDGQPYYWYQYQKKASAHIYTAYPDMSVYYIDYLLSQGYQYLRIPFYFDTTRANEIGGDAVTAPYFTIWVADGIADKKGGSSLSKNIYVNANEWIYYDMDLHQYRMNWVEETGNGADAYGMKLAARSTYQYLHMKACAASTYVYFGEMTFVKDSMFTIDESNDVVSLGEELNLADYYGIDENIKTYFDVDGVAMNTMTAVYKQHNVTIRPNLYTAQIGDGSYTVGSAAAWAIGYKSFTPVEKTINVQNGLDVSATTLVDVNGIATDVSIGAYTGADELTNAGFDVTQTYKKRYSDPDESAVVSDTVANKERGIFYVDVVATKGTQSISYEVTLDLYNSTEPVEYESFGHEDSKYAVKAYYSLMDTSRNSSITQDRYAMSYATLKTTYSDGKTSASGYTLNGMDLPFDDYMVLNTFGNAYKNTYRDMTIGHWDDWETSRKNLQAVYGLSGNTSAIVKEAGITYLAMDMSAINTTSPITSYMNMDTAISIYVTPRHTAAYYEKYSSDSKMTYTYGAPYYTYKKGSSWENEGDSGLISALTAVSAEGTPAYTWKQAYSAYFQSNVYTVSTITVATIAENYDAFANMSFPMLVSDRPQGFGSGTNYQNGILKLGMLIF